MFGSETLEVAIGVAVLFSFMSLFASAAREFIEVYAKQRAALVHQALTELFPPADDAAHNVRLDDSKKAAENKTIGEFYDSIVISPLFRGAYQAGKSLRELPSYITPGDFASAILNVARSQARGGTSDAALADDDWIKGIRDARLRDLVTLAFNTAGGDPEKARAFLEKRFNSQMERVSGWYKRSTQEILFAIGLVSAVFLNVDSIAVTQSLYRNDTLRELIVAHAQASPPSASPSGDAAPATAGPTARGNAAADAAPAASAETAVSNEAVPGADANSISNANQGAAAATNEAAETGGADADANQTAANNSETNEITQETPAEAASKVNSIAADLSGYGFPMGWTWNGDWPTPVPQCALHARAGKPCGLGISGSLLMLLGWIITAFAISLGAPFWFDILNKIMVIRSTVKPFEKSPPEGSEDRQGKAPVAILSLAPDPAAPKT